MAKPSEPVGGQDEQRIPHPCLADIPALPCRERPNQDCPYANGATNLHTKDTKIPQNGQAPAATPLAINASGQRTPSFIC